VLQFLVGVLVRHEQMPPARWAGFALVWVSLTLFATDQVRTARSRRREPVLVTEPTG
jgi:chloramphenicol-sensitive protein RarD